MKSGKRFSVGLENKTFMSSIPEKWKASEARLDFLLKFPGMMRSWEECRGKTIEHVVQVSEAAGVVLILSGHTFIIASPFELNSRTVQAGLEAARPHLQDHFAEAYEELERLTEKDQTLTRKSRLENILGAVRTNAPNIPELKKELQKLIDKLPD